MELEYWKKFDRWGLVFIFLSGILASPLLIPIERLRRFQTTIVRYRLPLERRKSIRERKLREIKHEIRERGLADYIRAIIAFIVLSVLLGYWAHEMFLGETIFDKIGGYLVIALALLLIFGFTYIYYLFRLRNHVARGEPIAIVLELLDTLVMIIKALAWILWFVLINVITLPVEFLLAFLGWLARSLQVDSLKSTLARIGLSLFILGNLIRLIASFCV
jgi:hypothetical protein